MNILQLLSSLNSDISIRAVAAHSKVLKDNNWNSYVFAPLGRELSYFKRWGSEIVSRRSSSLDIVYSKATIKEICNVVSSNSITILHVYDIVRLQSSFTGSENLFDQNNYVFTRKQIREECNRKIE